MEHRQRQKYYLIFKLPNNINDELNIKLNFQTYNNQNKKTNLNIYINGKKKKLI